MIATGLLLQLPLGLLALIVAGVVSAERIAPFRPHIIFLTFLLAALLTPPDVASQIMLAVPLCILFEGALWLGRLLRRGK
jgi:sec-independent protein translocase protein TatC